MPAILPQPVGDHPLPQCLDAQVQAMTGGQLLGREHGTEIRVMLPDQGQNGLTKRLAMPAIARPTTPPRDQRRRSCGCESTAQAIDLTTPHAYQGASRLGCQPVVPQIDQHTQPGQFALAHLDHRHRSSPERLDDSMPR